MTDAGGQPYWRVKWAALGAVVALALVGLGWLLTTAIKSPQEALASASPPPPSRITATVEKRSLDLEVIVPARVTKPGIVHGNLGVDERQRIKDDPLIEVRDGGQVVEGDLVSLRPNGDFSIAAADLEEAKGQSLQVRFGQASRPPETLVVPISALFTAASNQVAVVVVDGTTEREVPVEMGADADGWVSITPLDESQLQPGDEVLVSEPAS